jgi:outer membrane protein OmpA-like peptidoglycan-associated protein
MTLRRTGYEFLGWSTSPTGKVVSNPTSYVPIVSQRSLFAIWRIQSTKASSRVFFKPGRFGLRAGQKLVLRDLVDTLQDRTQISIKVSARRHNTAKKKLGKQRNTTVVQYLRSLGVEATFVRSNVGQGGSATAKKNNRVTLEASWTNPAS